MEENTDKNSVEVDVNKEPVPCEHDMVATVDRGYTYERCSKCGHEESKGRL
ncbi:MAG: hypothetical protein UT05_C0009G0045 [Parcubacteria group bacterium GW2011_GWF2_38_76]|nr:MAG: hypothetical protein UT05_C0009G0045 [Parcubacteria group bacterium GW2011_GWF2_38_76]